MPPINADDPNLVIAAGAIVMVILLLIVWQICIGVSTELTWESRVRRLLEQQGFRVRHMERKWFTRGPFPDLRLGRTMKKEWLIRVTADDALNRPREGWLRWQTMHQWQKGDTWAVKWDDESLPVSGQGAAGPPRGLATPLRYALIVLGAIAGLLSAWAAFPRAADDVLARSRAVYAALKSYSDTGTVDYDYGPSAAPLRERYTFTTLFRTPRHFLFDFTKGSPGGRFVVWGDGEVFHSWWAATGVEDAYPRGKGATAFAISTQPTAGSSVMISPLLFPGAGLIGTLEELADTTVEGTEMIDGHTCHKLVGVARSRYGSGNETNVRRTIVWIDAETLLVRRVFEDAPRGTASGIVARRTTTFEPKANPVLDEARFRFTPPSAQR